MKQYWKQMALDSKLKKMNIIIAGRSFPIKVSDAEERIIPSIEKEINEQIRQFQLSFKEKDIQDCITMALLKKSIECHNNEQKLSSLYEQSIDKLNADIKTALSS